MMRSMYAAVSGLKTHQTKMDVIGNNIANVNTVAFKSSSVTFQDILYQTTANASGANAATGVGGVNAKQIGLGVSMAATAVTVTSAGAAETTGNPFDIRLSDQSTTNFFVVNNGSENLFTRSGSFYVDGAGNLAMTSTGYTVMGWQVDPTTGLIKKDTVTPLRVMQPANMTSPPEATTNGTCSGVVDKNDPDVVSDEGSIKNLNFYDDLGYAYTARFSVKSIGQDGRYTIELLKVLDSEGNTFYDPTANGAEPLENVFGQTTVGATIGTYTSVASGFFMDTNGTIYYGSDNTGNELRWDAGTHTFTAVNGVGGPYSLKEVFGISDGLAHKIDNGISNAQAAYDAATRTLTVTADTTAYDMRFSEADGSFIGVGNGTTLSGAVSLNMSALGVQFSNISIDFSGTTDANNGGKSTLGIDAGDVDGTTGKGKKLGAMIGLSVDNNGMVYGTYDNGNTTVLGQIAVAQFANAAGLEKVGDNCYTTTLNSGEFDGIGVEIQADGSSMTSGELEMSNVDLSTEFTQMITTQRGFQANSRVITTSDSLLEELVNLKR